MNLIIINDWAEQKRLVLKMTGFLRVKSFYRGWIRERRRMGRVIAARKREEEEQEEEEEERRAWEWERELPVCLCSWVCECVSVCMRASVSVCVLTPGARITLWRALCLSGLFFTSLSLPLFPFIPSLYLLSSSLCLLSFLYFFSPHCAFYYLLSLSFFCLSSLLLWCRIFIA